VFCLQTVIYHWNGEGERHQDHDDSLTSTSRTYPHLLWVLSPPPHLRPYRRRAVQVTVTIEWTTSSWCSPKSWATRTRPCTASLSAESSPRRCPLLDDDPQRQYLRCRNERFLEVRVFAATTRGDSRWFEMARWLHVRSTWSFGIYRGTKTRNTNERVTFLARNSYKVESHLIASTARRQPTRGSMNSRHTISGQVDCT